MTPLSSTLMPCHVSCLVMSSIRCMQQDSMPQLCLVLCPVVACSKPLCQKGWLYCHKSSLTCFALAFHSCAFWCAAVQSVSLVVLPESTQARLCLRDNKWLAQNACRHLMINCSLQVIIINSLIILHIEQTCLRCKQLVKALHTATLFEHLQTGLHTQRMQGSVNRVQTCLPIHQH